MKDKEVSQLIIKEEVRQNEFVQLIASENYVSKDVIEAIGSVFTNKYAEGYPNARYYSGCEIADEIELLAIERAKNIFGARYANVQPHSGTQANLAAYLSILNPGDRILGMNLMSGGHLTHGYAFSISGQLFESKLYDVSPNTQTLDYDQIEKMALEFKPKLIICGASAYSRIIDFKRFRQIADKVNAYLLADVAHISGLIVAKLHPNPLEYGVDIVTTTTHKTLRGPRGGLILTNDKELSAKIDKAVFPRTQGGPAVNIIAAKAVAFGEASKKNFVSYQNKVIENAQAMVTYFLKHNVKIVSNGTDNHLFLIDVKSSYNISGQRAENLLYMANIIVNKNTIPFDSERPTITSGIRIGTPAMTSKSFVKSDFIKIAKIIHNILKNDSEKTAKKQRKDVKKILGDKKLM